MPVVLANLNSAVNDARFRIICVPMAKVIESGPKPKHRPEDAKPALRANLKLAERALDAHAPAVRPFSYMTLSVSQDTVQFIRERLLAARRDILDRVSRDEAVDRLYQLNIQLFPLSKTEKRSKP